MTPLVARRRWRSVEYLDDPSVDDALRARSLRDVVCANRLFGGTRAAVAELADALRRRQGDGRASLLDVGTGLGDIPERMRAAAARTGVILTTIGVDAAPSLAVASRARLDHAVCGDALALPLGDRSVDVVLCSQLLHHFERADALRLLRELDRVARGRVIVSDLRRSAVAAAGLWLASFPMRFHRVSRHDGVVSILRAFTPGELSDLVHEAVGVRPALRRRLGWRVTASWRPVGSPAREPGAVLKRD
jgi:SAM-dependent methyltransferase